MSSRMVLMKESPSVRKASRYERVWVDAGSHKPMDYAIYIPVCDDPNFVACGVVFVFKGENWEKPTSNMSFGLVHRSLVEQVSLKYELWNDMGTGAQLDVSLGLVPRMNTAWPNKSTLLGEPPLAFAIKGDAGFLMSKPSVPLPMTVRNTFIHIRSA